MKKRRVIAAVTTMVGVLTAVVGLVVLLVALCWPFGEAGSEGLHRWAYEGEQILVYGTGNSFYMMPARNAVMVAAACIVMGGAFALVARRLRRCAAVAADRSAAEG